MHIYVYMMCIYTYIWCAYILHIYDVHIYAYIHIYDVHIYIYMKCIYTDT